MLSQRGKRQTEKNHNFLSCIISHQTFRIFKDCLRCRGWDLATPNCDFVNQPDRVVLIFKKDLSLKLAVLDVFATTALESAQPLRDLLLD